jgi:hypothetical protein
LPVEFGNHVALFHAGAGFGRFLKYQTEIPPATSATASAAATPRAAAAHADQLVGS